MCMGDQDPMGAVLGQWTEVGQRIVAYPFRVHARIQNHFVVAGFEEVAVSPDLAAAGKITKSHVVFEKMTRKGEARF